MKSYKLFTTIILSVILLFSGCTEEKYTLGDLKSPTGIAVDAVVKGQSTENPNGDGSGVVNFTFTGNNVISYKVDFGDGSAPSIVPNVFSKSFNKVGTKMYHVTVTAIGTGGITSTVSKNVTVYYAYKVTPDIVTKLTGDSPEGKKWVVDKDAYGHMGNGPGPDRPDGIAETFTPIWWQAEPNSKTSSGMYNDVYVFTNTKKFTHITGGDLYGFKDMFARDFDPATPGSVIWEGEWKLTYPDYTEGFDYNGDPATDTQPERVYIVFERLGFLGFFSGSHKYMILELTDTYMHVRCATPGTNNAAWYIKLKAL